MGGGADERAPTSGQQEEVHVGGSTVGFQAPPLARLPTRGLLPGRRTSNMAASSDEEETHLQDMEEVDAGIEKRKMGSDGEEEAEEEGMGEEHSEEEEDEGNSSEDEKENEAEIQRLEEQVISRAECTRVSRGANGNEWVVTVNTVRYNEPATTAFKSRAALLCS